MVEEKKDDILSDETVVNDDSEYDETVPPIRYEITSFGADYDAEGLVNRIERDDIYIPQFQRVFIWTIKQASRFIESLLLGLPVPGIFLAREADSKRLLVIDGQQRLKTLQFFFKGFFTPEEDKEDNDKLRVFKLIGVQEQFEGLTYKTLNDQDRIVLNDSIIHATIVKQDAPVDDQSSIYHIFERLNTSGRRLSPQQIRVAIYHGKFLDMIRELNNYEPWRKIYGVKSKTLKDQELILRFLAMYFGSNNYKRPMQEFLNKFSEQSGKREDNFLVECQKLFRDTIEVVIDAVGDKAFRPERALNAAVFDSIMVAIARNLKNGNIEHSATIRIIYDQLIMDNNYQNYISQSTSDEKNVAERIKIATERFSTVR